MTTKPQMAVTALHKKPGSIQWERGPDDPWFHTPRLRPVRKWLPAGVSHSGVALCPSIQERSACYNTDGAPVWPVKGNPEPEDHILWIPFTGYSAGTTESDHQGTQPLCVRKPSNTSVIVMVIPWHRAIFLKTQLYLKKKYQKKTYAPRPVFTSICYRICYLEEGSY